MTMGPTTLSEAFGSFTQSAVRLEGLGVYAIPEEGKAFSTFLAGGTPDMSFLEEWLSTVSDAVASGKAMRRLRMLDDPPTAYEQFELQVGYPLSIRSGEEIRTLGRREIEVALPDSWIFDELYVFEMLYSDAGEYLGSRRVAERCASRWVRDVLSWWSHAIPLSP